MVVSPTFATPFDGTPPQPVTASAPASATAISAEMRRCRSMKGCPVGARPGRSRRSPLTGASADGSGTGLARSGVRSRLARDLEDHLGRPDQRAESFVGLVGHPQDDRAATRFVDRIPQLGPELLYGLRVQLD